MTRKIWGVAVGACLLSAAGITAQEAFTGPPQAARGHELFFKTAKPEPCGSCHTVAGQGTAVGPDLKMWARVAPRAAAMAITATVTEKVVTVKPKSGPDFPAMTVSEDEKGYKFYDLTNLPPTVKEMAKADVDSVKTGSTWKHPPGREKYTGEQLADLVAYIRWAGAKDKKPVTPDDVE